MPRKPENAAGTGDRAPPSGVLLPPRFASWFAGRGWRPRPHQLSVLETAQSGADVLLVAPTGGGKTLAGFLPSLVELAETGERGRLHTLYVSPLKALATDIARNLLDPVGEMALGLRVETRTGDTPADRRARQRAHPPEILLTTPESLLLLLSRPDAAEAFAGLSRIVIDEVHALAGIKRGDQLSLCLARLRLLAPEARRIGLSATVAWPDSLRAFVGTPEQPATLIEAPRGTPPALSMMLPEAHVPWSGRMGLAGASVILRRIEQADTTIVFVNTRAQSELLFAALWRINENTLPIALHHGSLDIEQRRRVEAAMARGTRGEGRDRLRAVIATSSLDLGIDWGGVDQVIQVGAPKGVSRLLQRIGRANHRMDEASNAVLVPANRFEVLECQAAIAGVEAMELDGEHPRPGGLDVLAQHILLMAASAPFTADALFDEVRLAAPYAALSRRDFDDTLGFVEDGGYALHAYERYRKLFRDSAGLIQIRGERVARQARMNAGTIVEAPVLKVRMGGPRGFTLGEIEESFANALRPGDAFLFAGRKLCFQRLRETVVEVSEGGPGDPVVPTYAGSKYPLTSGLAARVRRMLHDPSAWSAYPEPVREWLELQRERSLLPGPDDLLVEVFPRHGRFFLVAYCFEGRNAHQTLGMLLTRRLSRDGAAPLGFVATDYALALWCANPPGDIPLLFAPDMLGDDLEDWMAESSMLRRTFRNVAVIAGLIERQHPGQTGTRRQVTINSDLIYDVLRRHQPDHVLLRATRAEASGGLTDVDRLADMLVRVQDHIRVARLSRVSPLAIPVMLDIGREFVRNEADEDALLAETEALLAEAKGEAEPSTEELVLAPGHAQELRRLTRTPGGRERGRDRARERRRRTIPGGGRGLPA
ncbi:ligase-associated DNA damage response DEXH box helicase [Endosaccharibacter trunci]|uniref:ligase-associated DNA damage response DEXH box helicase n=1 Tax=Endosaccharibacter trunci TaxID=2812733 RepID=UPI003BF5FC04